MNTLVRSAVPGTVLSSATGLFYLVVFNYVDVPKNQVHLGVLRGSKFGSFHFDFTCKFIVDDSFVVI